MGDWVDQPEKRATFQSVQIRLIVSADNIETLPIAVTGTDKMVPLEQIADITMGKGPSRIEHADGKRMIAVSANVQGRSPVK